MTWEGGGWELGVGGAEVFFPNMFGAKLPICWAFLAQDLTVDEMGWWGYAKRKELILNNGPSRL